jgi:hypothetical protein
VGLALEGEAVQRDWQQSPEVTLGTALTWLTRAGGMDLTRADRLSMTAWFRRMDGSGSGSYSVRSFAGSSTGLEWGEEAVQ